jgi:hypothetical protein
MSLLRCCHLGLACPMLMLLGLVMPMVYELCANKLYQGHKTTYIWFIYVVLVLCC